MTRSAALFALTMFWMPIVAAAAPTIVPAPREVAWTRERFDLGASVVIVASSAEERQVGRLLAAEMERLRGIPCKVASSGAASTVVLALADSPAGKARLARWQDWAKWPAPRNPEEAYLLQVDGRGAAVVAQTPRGLWYGSQTLLQLVQPADDARGPTMPGVQILDYPQLAFRGVHLCIFPNTELAAIRQAMLLAARYKYNAVVIEPWAAIQSKSHPETAYEHAYTPDEVRPLVDLGRALHMDMIPMLNSWGHASGMRSRSAEHVVLDRFPEHRSLYEADGWSFRLDNPKAREHIFDRYGELLELFGPVRYFHAGMDEAWGHLGPAGSPATQGEEPRRLLAGHLHAIHDYLAARKIQVLMWHDMFVERGDPKLGRAGPANSLPPVSPHLVLEELPKDVIIAAWNYDVSGPWPVPRYFRDKGFRVVVSPWKSKRNTISLLNTAKELDLLGVLATTWDSLDVSLPSVAQAGVLAWEPPGADLGRIPFDHWLVEIRGLPICRLPRLEDTASEESQR